MPKYASEIYKRKRCGTSSNSLGPKVLDLEWRGEGVGSAPSLTTELLEQACTANGLGKERFYSQCQHL